MIKEVFLYIISIFVFKEKNIAFGAWNGEKYGDNPGYLAEYLLKINTSYALYWVGKKGVKDSLPKGLVFLDIDDKTTKWKLMKMKYVFVSHSISDLSRYNVFARSKIVLTWHGIGIKALKNLQSESFFRSFYRKAFRNYDYFLASSEKNAKRISDLFESYGANRSNILLTGQSRVVNLLKSNSRPIKNIILYLPTFRNDNQFSFSSMSKDQKNKMMLLLEKYDYYIIEKRHPRELNLFRDTKNKRIKYLSEDIKTDDLMLKSSVLITDYSSVVFDYLILKRPIIHFSYDLDSYLAGASGLYYDFEDIAPGSVAKNFDDLLIELEQCMNSQSYGKEKREEISKEMIKYDDGKASERITDYFNLY